MERLQVKAFMDIVRYGNISLAAEKNFTSQSHISNLIKSLETELGVNLLIRQKGKRTIELTEQGKQFLQLAEQYKTIWIDMESIGRKNVKNHLTIGTNSMIPNLLETFLLNHLNTHQNIILDIHTYHSRELISKLHARSIDLAFVHNIYNDPDIIITPLYEQPMYLICNKENNYHNDMDIQELPREKEVYVRWNNDFYQWHQKYFNDDNYLVRVTGGNLSIFLKIPGAWTIGPLSICTYLRNQDYYSIYTLRQTPPMFKCYQLEHRYSRTIHTEAIDSFKKELNDYLRDESSWFLITL